MCSQLRVGWLAVRLWALLGLAGSERRRDRCQATAALVGSSSGACCGVGVTTGLRQSLNFTPMGCGSSSPAQKVSHAEGQQLLCWAPPTCSPLLSALGSGLSQAPSLSRVPPVPHSAARSARLPSVAPLFAPPVLRQLFDLDLSPPFCRMTCGRLQLMGCCRIR